MNDLKKYFDNNTNRIIHKWEHYFEIYDRHFSRYRNKEIVILEIGVFQGGSLQEVSKYGMTKDCGLLVNASRAIIYAGEKENFADEARAIAKQYQSEMASYLST